MNPHSCGALHTCHGTQGGIASRLPACSHPAWRRRPALWPLPTWLPSLPLTPPHPPPPHPQVITSSALPGWEDHVTLLASTTLPQAGGAPQQLRMRLPRVHAYFTGTGEGAPSLGLLAGAG